MRTSLQPLAPGSMKWQERDWLREQRVEWWEEIFDRVAAGEAPAEIAAEHAVRYAILARVIGEDERRAAQYEGALRIAADQYAHAVVGISDDVRGEVADRKLRIDTRLKVASKWHRARYGESVTVEQVRRVVLDLKFGVRSEIEDQTVAGRLIEEDCALEEEDEGRI